MNSFIQRQDMGSSSGFDHLRRDFFQIGITFNLPVVQPAVFLLPYLMDQATDHSPGPMIVNGTRIVGLPDVGQNGKGPIGTAMKRYFIRIHRGWLLIQKIWVKDQFSQIFLKPARIAYKFAKQLLANFDGPGYAWLFLEESLEAETKFF